jgi:Uma2 family endonuclease
MTAAHAEETPSVRLPGRALTLDDVALLGQADENHRYELTEGNLSVMPPADDEHNAIVSELLVWLVMHGFAARQVQANSGVRISGDHSGRTPDLVLRRTEPTGRTVWTDAIDVALVVEVVSPGSAKIDRLVKPGEYASAGIEHFWRIERDAGQPTAHLYRLGVDEDGEPAYVSHRAVLLKELLDGNPPPLA